MDRLYTTARALLDSPSPTAWALASPETWATRSGRERR
jgi:hypothetical protein